jgi:hypothetical protein
MGVTWFLFFFAFVLVLFLGNKGTFVKKLLGTETSDKIMGVTWFLFFFAFYGGYYRGDLYVIYGCRTKMEA